MKMAMVSSKLHTPSQYAIIFLTKLQVSSSKTMAKMRKYVKLGTSSFNVKKVKYCSSKVLEHKSTIIATNYIQD